MKAKKTVTGAVGTVIAILCVFLGTYLDSNVAEIQEAISIPYAGDMASLAASLSIYGDNTVVAISFGLDGVVILHSDKIQLQGDTDSAWNVGDILVLFKQSGTWVEIGRRLKY